jgi:hypothetical protein
MALQERRFQHELDLEKATSKAAWWVLTVLMVFLSVVISLMVWLVFSDRVSGDALLFLVGDGLGVHSCAVNMFTAGSSHFPVASPGP